MISVKCPHCHVGLKVDEGKIPLDVRIPRTDLDQVDLPDPVLDAISELREENNKLREELEILKKEIKGGNVQ